MKYPYIENADEILTNICMHETNRKYDGSLRRTALNQLDRELEAVRNQGASSAFLTIVDVLNAVKAGNKEFVFRGTMAASLIAFVIGLTEADPLETDSRLYPVSGFEIKGDRIPVFELITTPALGNRLSSYFDAYPGTEPVTKLYEQDNRIFRVYFGETGEEGYADTFHLVVVSV